MMYQLVRGEKNVSNNRGTETKQIWKLIVSVSWIIAGAVLCFVRREMDEEEEGQRANNQPEAGKKRESSRKKV